MIEINTPICEFLEEYAKKDMLRMHMPGHKGKYTGSIIDDILKYDITEIKNADSLFEADGIILESENNAAKLFGTYQSLFSAEGSTLAIQTMLGLMKSENRRIIAARNAHRAFLNACALLDLNVSWIYPQYNSGILSGRINISDIESELKKSDRKSCVYITSPDYLGNMADIKSISALCRKYDAVLLVDNAHGACLGFLENPCHPIQLGADMCCDSAHKMLPALTGTAYLHIGNPAYIKKARQMMSVFASTSPSYIMLASLDYCNRYISENIRNDIRKAADSVRKLKNELSFKYSFSDGEPFHIAITGINGNDMAEKLRKYDIECEYSDFCCIVLLASPVNSDNDFKRLKNALYEIQPIKSVSDEKIIFPELEQEISLNQALFADFEEISIEDAEGKICAMVNVPCPPAIPIAVCGERITHECIEIYRRYNIKTVNTVR